MAEYKVKPVLRDKERALPDLNKSVQDILVKEVSTIALEVKTRILRDVGWLGWKDNEAEVLDWIGNVVMRDYPKPLVKEVVGRLSGILSAPPKEPEKKPAAKPAKPAKKASSTAEEAAPDGSKITRKDMLKQLGQFFIKYGKKGVMPSADKPPSMLPQQYLKHWQKFWMQNGATITDKYKDKPWVAWPASVGYFYNWMKKHYGIDIKAEVSQGIKQVAAQIEKGAFVL